MTTVKIDVATAKTAALVAFYNEHAPTFGKKHVVKFADRQTAELRVNQLLADLAAAEPEPETKTDAVKEHLAAAVSASWQDPDVRAARSARHAVDVDGVKYKSVMAAFVALGLDVKKLIKFRSDLVAYGEQAYGDHTFKLVPKQ
jgi:hypothetical protein